jgi:DNA polymerase III epsilon subunit-like protein
MRPMIVLDIETTGLDPDRHAIVSLGAVELENPDNQFYEECQIPEGAEVTQEALDINGFTQEEITDPSKPSVGMLLESFLEWVRCCEGWTVAGHNVHYDTHFIDQAAKQFNVDPLDHGRGGVFHDRIVDTHSLVWMDIARSGKSLPKEGDLYSGISSSFVFDYVGIGHERGTHNALEDAKLTAEAVSRLLYNKELFSEFA